MSKRRLMMLASLFLALALAFPIYMIFESWNEDYADLAHRGESVNFDQTDIQSYFQDATVRHQILFTILAVCETVFVILFVITLRASLLKP